MRAHATTTTTTTTTKKKKKTLSHYYAPTINLKYLFYTQKKKKLYLFKVMNLLFIQESAYKQKLGTHTSHLLKKTSNNSTQHKQKIKSKSKDVDFYEA